jgi:hypothetical protein
VGNNPKVNNSDAQKVKEFTAKEYSTHIQKKIRD